MQFPEGTKSALIGAVAGAIAVSIIGFNWGGWVTGGSATDMSEEVSIAAVAMALTPYCIQKSQDDPKSVAVMADIEETSSYQRRGVIEDAGWATPLGAENPDRELAELCLIALTEGT